MRVKTKYFGEVELDENKVITFDKGLLGFESLKQYTILYDVEEGSSSNISWFQSLDEPALALPVVNPLLVKSDYNPVVEDEVLKSLGEFKDEDLVILLTLTVPTDITKMTSNLKAPLIINSETRKGCQIVVENQDYEVKYNVYDILQQKKKGEM